MHRPGVLLLLALLVPALDARAGDEEAWVELHHQLVGPAWKTWTLRLQPNGKIVEERVDPSANRHRVVRTRCKLTQAASEQAREASRRIVDSAPSTVEGSGGGIPLDGPFKQISVHQGGERHSSTSYAPQEANASDEAKAFLLAWQQVQALLTCGAGDQANRTLTPESAGIP
jgi:hypothetical protein